MKFTFFLLLALLTPSAHADLRNPIRTLSGLIRPTSEKAWRVKTARILLVDYELVRRDFPVMVGKSDTEVDQWLLNNTAYVTEEQARQVVVNTQIEFVHGPDGQEVTRRDVLRPELYNRACVFPVEGGLIDAKGTGAPHPRQGSHGNGLATTGEVIREFIFQKMVQKIFKHARAPFETVACYGVIDLGFQVKHGDGSTSPAGIVIRQAHKRLSTVEAQRRGHMNTFMDRESSTKIERTLRYYGMTSSGETVAGPGRDVINIQGLDGNLVDFGSYLVRDQYHNPTVTYWDRSNANAKPVFSPGKPGWINPDSRVRLPFSIWGYSVTGNPDPKADNVWVWSHELAENFKRGVASRHDVWTHYSNMLNAIAFPPELEGQATAAELGACVETALP